MGRVKTYDEALRQRLIAEAADVLAVEGPSGLTLRRVAAAAGTSTTAVYDLFGDKDRLLTAMYVEGFAQLGAALTAARKGTPLEALGAMGMAYRRSALARPHLYGLMFGREAPDAGSKEVADAAYAPLVEGVRACVEKGSLRGSPETVATYLWAVAHGLVSLELAGLVPGSARARTVNYRDALTVAVVGWLTAP